MNQAIKFIGILSVSLCLFGSFTHAQPAQRVVNGPNDLPITIAHMRALDKITARTVDIDIRSDEEVQFGTLFIRVRTCRSRPPEETPETFAFVEVDDVYEGQEERVRIFTGWMMASSPALNALEHAVYDIWVISCTTLSDETPTGNE